MLENTIKRFSRLGRCTRTHTEKIDKMPMHFIIDTYKIEGLGSFSSISMHAMLGLMKMESFVFTAENLDLPLLSYDWIKAAGKESLILELYNTQLGEIALSGMDAVKAHYASLPDLPKEPRWYDGLLMSPSLRKSGGGTGALQSEWLDAYLELIPSAVPCEPEAKIAKTREYVDGLLNNGGPAVDQFKKMLGNEKAASLFKKYVFCCE